MNFDHLTRDAVTTNETISRAIAEATEFAAQYAPGVPPDSIIWLYVNAAHERDPGERALLRGALSLLIEQYRWEREHASKS